MKKMVIFITVCLVLCAMMSPAFSSRPCFADSASKNVTREKALALTQWADELMKRADELMKSLAPNPEPSDAAAAMAAYAVALALALDARAVQEAALLGCKIWDWLAYAPSNPDPHCGMLAVASPVSGFDPVDPAIGAVLADNLNKSLDLAGEMVSNSRALDLTLRRYYGAIDAGDTADQLMQQKVATSFILTLEKTLLEYANTLVAISDNLQGTDFASVSVTVSEVLALRDEIVASGQFPPEEDFVFEGLDATQAEIDGAIHEVSLVTGETLSDSDLTGAVIFQRSAQALLKVNIRELLPEGFEMASSLPTITSITPNHGKQSETLVVAITDTNFAGATGVSFGAGITVKSFNVDSSAQITANISIDADATTGARNVSVTTLGGTANLVNGFTVGGCFIATAAYGTPMAEEIEVLREFRDRYLLTNPVGEALVEIYYQISPPIAEFITEHPSLKPIVRVGLVPAVAMSTVAVKTTLAQKIAIVGSMALVSALLVVWLRRRSGKAGARAN